MARDFRKLDPVSCRETRLLPKKYPFKTICFLFDNNITFFDSEEVSGIRIYHPELFRLQKAAFEMNWELFG